jgi:hypothetical protein
VAFVEFLYQGVLVGSDDEAPFAYNVAIEGIGLRVLGVVAEDDLGLRTSLEVDVFAVPLMSGLSWEAEDGAIFAPFRVDSGIVVQDVETADPADGGRAIYRFVVPEPGGYTVECTLDAPAYDRNSLFVNVDGDPLSPDSIWDIPLTPGLSERVVSWRGDGTPDEPEHDPVVFNLAAGEHVLKVTGREADVSIDYITIVPSNLPPSVMLMQPTSGRTVAAGSTITVLADANDPDGHVALVEFFCDGKSVGTDDTPPFSCDVLIEGPGQVFLQAEAEDDLHVRAASDTIAVQAVEPAIGELGVSCTPSTGRRAPLTALALCVAVWWTRLKRAAPSLAPRRRRRPHRHVAG